MANILNSDKQIAIIMELKANADIEADAS